MLSHKPHLAANAPKGDCMITPPGYFMVSKTSPDVNVAVRAALPYVHSLAALETVMELSKQLPSFLCSLKPYRPTLGDLLGDLLPAASAASACLLRLTADGLTELLCSLAQEGFEEKKQHPRPPASESEQENNSEEEADDADLYEDGADEESGDNESAASNNEDKADKDPIENAAAGQGLDPPEALDKQGEIPADDNGDTAKIEAVQYGTLNPKP